MAQMAQFSFPYYFTIPNSEFRIPKFIEQTLRLIILIYFNSANVWVKWVKSSIQQTVIQRGNGSHMVRIK